MSKTFRAWKIDEPLLLPATVHDFVADNHQARFVLALVRDELDLAAIVATYGSAHGQPPFHPVMMVALLLYAYTQGLHASRRIARACEERVDFMSIVGLEAPDFRTIAQFRQRHLEALRGLFNQVLHLCVKAGLVKLGHVALDGTKIQANASKHKAMSYERMEARAAELEAEVAGWLSAAAAADAEGDRAHGPDKRGDEMPDWVADKQRRAERIRRAKAELEAEAKAAAEAKARAKAEAAAGKQAKAEAAAAAEMPAQAEAAAAAETPAQAEAAAAASPKAPGHDEPGPPPPPPSPEAKPDKKAQKNFTDPESRIMKSKDGFVQAYNAQIAVDAEAQIIVAQEVSQSAADSGRLVAMTDAVEANLGARPEQLSADAGYCSEANLVALEERGIDAYIATGRARDAAAGTAGPGAAAAPERIGPPTRKEAMREKIRAGGHASPYRLRKQLPEPVFGQIKEARGFRRFLLRGLAKVTGEWSLACTAHNLSKLYRGRSLSTARAVPAAAC